MSFFKTSFSTIGEALKTISLAIALLATLMSGIGYVYGTLSAQKAMASELTLVNERLAAIEDARRDTNLWRFRIEQTEIGIENANTKLDRMEQVLNDVRIAVQSLTSRP